MNRTFINAGAILAVGLSVASPRDAEAENCNPLRGLTDSYGWAWGQNSNGQLGEAPYRACGLIMQGTRLRRGIAASGELPFAPLRTPMVFVFRADNAGTSSIESNETARVVGTNFLPASDPDAPVRIQFDHEVVAERVPVQPDSSFSVDILVRHLPGEMIVTAEQRDGQRRTVERAIIDVMTKD